MVIEERMLFNLCGAKQAIKCQVKFSVDSLGLSFEFSGSCALIRAKKL